MLTLPSSVRIYLVLDAVSMHASFDALAARVRRLGLDPTSGHLFLFLNKLRSKPRPIPSRAPSEHG